MKAVFMMASLMGLLLTVVPSFLVFGQMMSRDTYSMLMTTGTILWFSTAPFWMKKERHGER